MEFRNKKRLIPEFVGSESPCITSRLRKVISDLDDYVTNKLHKDLIITSLCRTEQEQREILAQMGVEYYASVHMFGRGADCIINRGTVKEYEDVVTYINSTYPYPNNKKTALYHKVGSGSWHLHLQTPPGVL